MQKTQTIDLNDANRISEILSNSSLTDPTEIDFVKALRYRTSKQANGGELIDFQQKEGQSAKFQLQKVLRKSVNADDTTNEDQNGANDEIREGNTLFAGKYVRRGLPVMQTEFSIKQGAQLELVSFLKPHGDCCHFSYLPKEKLFLVATRNLATLVANSKDLEAIQEMKYFLHRDFGKLFFKQVNLKKAKELLANRTLVGEYIQGQGEGLIKYPDERLLMHSCVDNATGKVLAASQSAQIIQSCGLQTVPFKSEAIFTNLQDKSKLTEKFEQIRSNYACKTLSEVQEGVVLQLIDKKQDLVILPIVKVKSIEYSLFRLMQKTLTSALDKNELDTQRDKVFQSYLKQHRQILKNINQKFLPHPDSFYLDLFSMSYNLVSQRKTRDFEYYRKSLFQDASKFFTLVVQSNQEKQSQEESDKYTGTVDFIPQYDFSQKVVTEGVLLKEKKQLSKSEPQQVPDQQAESQKVALTQKQTQSNDKSKQILHILVAPPLGLRKDLIESQFKSKFSKVHFSKRFDLNSFKQQPLGDNDLVIVSKLDEGVLESKSLFKVFLHVYKVSNSTHEELTKRLYLDVNDYQQIDGVTIQESLDSLSGKQSIAILKKFGSPKQILVEEADIQSVVCGTKKGPKKEEKVVEQEPLIQSAPIEQVKQVEKQVKAPQTTKATKPDKQQNQKQVVRQEEEIKLNYKPIAATASTSQSSFVFIPIGMPGMGKTTFLEQQLQPMISKTYPNAQFKIVSSDRIRQQCIHEYMKDHKNCSTEEANKKTVQIAQKKTQELFEQMVKQQSGQQCFIYLDKNTPPSELPQTLKMLSDHNSPSSQLTPIFLLPKSSKFESNPFSLTFLLQCYSRCLSRLEQQSDDDRTVPLTTDPLVLMRILLLFYKQFDGVDLTNLIGGKQFLVLEMTSQMQLPREMETLMAQCVKSGLQDEDNIEDAVNKIVQYRQLFGVTQAGASPSAGLPPRVSAQLKQMVDNSINSQKQQQQKQQKIEEERLIQEEVKVQTTPAPQLQPAKQERPAPIEDLNQSSDQEYINQQIVTTVVPKDSNLVNILNEIDEQEKPIQTSFVKEDDLSKGEISDHLIENQNSYEEQEIATENELDQSVIRQNEGFNAMIQKSKPQESKQQNTKSKKQKNKKGDKIQAIDVPIQAYKPVAFNNSQGKDDEFETVTNQRSVAKTPTASQIPDTQLFSQQTDDFSSSEDDSSHKVPNQLVLSFQDQSSQKTAQLFRFIPLSLHTYIKTKKLATNMLKDEIEYLNNLINQQARHAQGQVQINQGGWKVMTNPQMTCADIRRNKDNLQDSTVWQGGFTNGLQFEVKVDALVYVPQRVIMGICSRQNVACPCDWPFVVLFQNDWHSFKHSKELYEQCMGRNGSGGGKFNNALKEERHAHANVKGSFCDLALQAFFMPVDPPINVQGTTKIIY